MKILAIGAHPDDIETGLGATISANSVDTTILTLTDCGCEKEWQQSMNLLQPERRILYHYMKRFLDQIDVREGIRETLEQVRDEVKPDVVFTHHPSNPHQDHRAVYEETLRVFKRHSIIGYSVAGWYSPNLYIPVNLRDVRLKTAALKCYKSQSLHESGDVRRSMLPTVIKGIAEANGMQINEPYAEAFELLRGIWRV